MIRSSARWPSSWMRRSTFAKIGLHSAQVALDYGNPADPTNHRHKDMVFDKNHAGEQKWEFFLNKQVRNAVHQCGTVPFRPRFQLGRGEVLLPDSGGKG